MKNILLIGDVMLDEWMYGNVHRISPEAPIPILDSKYSKYSLGGAGNVFANLISLGIKPFFVSGISTNSDGIHIKNFIKDICGYNTYFYDITETFKKTRVCCGQQQIVRIDVGEGKDINTTFLNRVLCNCKDINTIMVSDYGKGTITSDGLKMLSDYCLDTGTNLLIDPYNRDYYHDRRMYYKLIKFNKSEAEFFTNKKIISNFDLIEVGQEILSMINTEGVMITLGSDGIAYFDEEQYYNEPLKIVDSPVYVYDVCGAGDVVFAVVGFCMTMGYSIEKTMKIAARAGKLAVSKKGTSIVTIEELNGD
jgi:rfaE bifunctional protein kinase chain/domain